MTRRGARRRTDGIFYRQWNNTWYSSITGKKLPLYDDQGQRIKGRHNEAAAKKAYARLLLAIEDGAGHAADTEPDAGDIVADYVVYVHHRAETAGGSPTHAANAQMIGRAFLEFVGPETKAKSLTPKHLEDFLHAQRERWSQGTCRLAGTMLITAFYHAVKKTRRLDHNPLVGASLPPLKYRTAVLSAEELDRVRAGASPALWRVCWFLLRTGCRPGEALKLRVKHVHEVNGRLKCVLSAGEHKAGGKTGKARHIFLAEDVEKYVRERLEEAKGNPEAPLLPSATGKAWNYRTCKNVFYTLRKKLGLRKELTLYAFRHTFATRHLAKGIAPTKVAAWMGNTLPVMEKAYWHPLDSDQEKLLEGLGEATYAPPSSGKTQTRK